VPLDRSNTGSAKNIPKSDMDLLACIQHLASLELGPEHLRWFWSFAVQGPMTRADKVATLEEAKAQFQEGCTT
jgi:hypothetical protein